jgi:hypothetical protein
MTTEEIERKRAELRAEWQRAIAERDAFLAPDRRLNELFRRRVEAVERAAIAASPMGRSTSAAPQ